MPMRGSTTALEQRPSLFSARIRMYPSRILAEGPHRDSLDFLAEEAMLVEV